MVGKFGKRFPSTFLLNDDKEHTEDSEEIHALLPEVKLCSTL